jgi:hypothetical protein
MKYHEKFPKVSDLTRLDFVSRFTSVYYGVKLLENFFSEKYGVRSYEDTAEMERQC